MVEAEKLFIGLYGFGDLTVFYLNLIDHSKLRGITRHRLYRPAGTVSAGSETRFSRGQRLTEIRVKVKNNSKRIKT
jgi:hypothetical protein